MYHPVVKKRNGRADRVHSEKSLISFISISKAKLVFGYRTFLTVFISEAEVCFEQLASAHAKSENGAVFTLSKSRIRVFTVR